MYFIRHGQAENNIKGVFAGTLDYELTDLGRKQADTIENITKDEYPGVSKIITSPEWKFKHGEVKELDFRKIFK